MNQVPQGAIERILGRLNLRFPTLFVIFLALTLLDLIVPDFVPLADEIGLALLTALFAMWKRRRNPAPPAGGPSGGGATPPEALPPAEGR